MGIYDQIHGECPHCGFFIGRKKEVSSDRVCGLQIKDWITANRSTTYDFYVGDAVPYMVDHITGMPIVDTFHEYCFKCRQYFQIPFKVIQEEKNNFLVYKVIMQEFEK